MHNLCFGGKIPKNIYMICCCIMILATNQTLLHYDFGYKPRFLARRFVKLLSNLGPSVVFFHRPRSFFPPAEGPPERWRGGFSVGAEPAEKNREKNEAKPRRPPKKHGFIFWGAPKNPNNMGGFSIRHGRTVFFRRNAKTPPPRE